MDNREFSKELEKRTRKFAVETQFWLEVIKEVGWIT
jgi:hypothetical protein